MGVTRAFQGRLPEAIEYFQAAIHSQPDTPKAHVQLAHALWNKTAIKPRLRRCAARHSLRQKTQTFGLILDSRWHWWAEYRRPSSNFTKRSGLNPNSAETHNNLGLALLASGKAQESIPEFEVALRLKPELKGAADNLRRAQAQSGSQR